ncbi:MAG TPA: DUF4956 domain-containing protein [Myxococcota bacterium]
MDFLSNAIGGTSPSSAGHIFVTLLLSWVLGQAIAAVYAATFRGLSYQRTFAQALVVGGIVAAMLMLAIGNSLARGIGIAGTLALIRFRTNLRDPLDMVFIFASFGAGIATGTGNGLVAVIGTALFLTVVGGMRVSGFGGHRQHDGVVRMRVPSGPKATAAVLEILKARCRRFALVTLRDVAQGTKIEVVYHVSLRKPGADEENELVHALGAVEGAEGVGLSMQESTVEL